MRKIVICVAAVLLAGVTAFCEFRPAPIVEKDLLGAWAGCAQGCTEFYRLDLKRESSGSLVILQPDLEHTLYAISEWKVESEQLKMVPKPQRGTETIEVKSLRLNTCYVEIEIWAPVGKWKRTVTLYNEKDWDERTRRAREASK